jgi:hypothetical protein
MLNDQEINENIPWYLLRKLAEIKAKLAELKNWQSLSQF